MQSSLLTLVSLLGFSLAGPITQPATALVPRESSLNAFLTLLLNYLPAVGGTLDDVADTIESFENDLATLTGDQITYNELSNACATYTLIFARGTTEPGNVGILVGPPFIDALKSALGSTTINVQGVNDYSASITGYVAGGDATGSAEMATQIEQAYASCPKTKLVAAGYSQGAQLVHNSIAMLPAATAAWISSVVVFGDPDDGQAIPNVSSSKVDTYCYLTDNICDDGDLILPAHLLYAASTGAAASFVVSA